MTSQISQRALTIDDFNIEEAIYEFQVQETHLDTFGHMNNATYLTIFEQARWDMITKNGWGMDRIMREKRGPVVLDINITFKSELRLRQMVKIRSKATSFVNSKVLTYEQEMFDDSGKVYTKFKMTAGLFDLKERKLMGHDPEWLKAVGLTLKA